MRDSGLASIGPNLAKSTLGHGRSSSAPAGAPAEVGVAALGGPAAPFLTASTSDLRLLPLAPVPWIQPRSTPSSRASFRTPGPAYAPTNADSSNGFLRGGADCGGALAAGVAAEIGGAPNTGGGPAFACAASVTRKKTSEHSP